MSRYRVLWIFLAILSIPISIHYRDIIVDPTGVLKDSFSYYGTFATLVGLLITIIEVLHSISTTKSLKDSVNSRIEKYENFEKSWTNGTCIEVIEKVIDYVGYGKYTDAKFLIRDLRKQLNRVSPDLLNQSFSYIDGKKITLEQLELNIHSYEKSTARSPVSKPQLRGLCAALIELRAMLEASRAQIGMKGD